MLRVLSSYRLKRTIRAGFLICLSIIVSLQLVSSPAFAAAPQDTYTWQRNIGTAGCPPPAPVNIGQTYGLAFNNNRLYVGTQSKVYIFDADGNGIAQFGSSGSGNGQFAYTDGIALDAAGNIYVVDTNNNRVQKFDANGNYLSQFGSNGAGNGQLNAPQGIALDSSGNIYVADWGNNRVQKFDTNGNYVSQFGSSGSGNGQLNNPSSVAFDSSGNLYITDTGNRRVQKFDASGNYISQFATKVSGTGAGLGPVGIAVDETGDVYISTQAYPNYYVQKYNASGVYLSQIGGAGGTGNGQFNFPQGIALDGGGNVYVADSSNQRVQKFGSAGNFLSKITQYAESANNQPSQLCYPHGVARDAAGRLYVADQGWNNVKIYNTDSTLKQVFGAEGTGNGQFNTLSAIALDSSGNIYASDATRIQKFSPSGTYLMQFSPAISGAAYVVPAAMAVGKDDTVYVSSFGYSADFSTIYSVIQKYSSNGTLLSQFGSYGAGDGQFGIYAMGIAIDSSGNIYASDYTNNRIEKFDPGGNYLSQFGTSGSSDGQFTLPAGITIDSLDNIYVSDFGTGRIQKFNKAGAYLGQLGSPGTGNDQLGISYSLTTDSDGNIYVADDSNSRVSIWNAPIIPSASQNVKATALSPTSLYITWDAPKHVGSSPITAYRVMYRLAGTSAWMTAGEVSAATFSYALADLTPSATYEIQVAALNTIGASTNNSEVHATLAIVRAPNAGLKPLDAMRPTADLYIVVMATLGLGGGIFLRRRLVRSGACYTKHK